MSVTTYNAAEKIAKVVSADGLRIARAHYEKGEQVEVDVKRTIIGSAIGQFLAPITFRGAGAIDRAVAFAQMWADLADGESVPDPQTDPVIDYRDLLSRYIDHVGDCESITFLSGYWREQAEKRFSAAELAELDRLDEETRPK